MPVSELIVMVRSRKDVELLLGSVRESMQRIYSYDTEQTEEYRAYTELESYLQDRIAKYDDATARGEVEDDDKIPF